MDNIHDSMRCPQCQALNAERDEKFGKAREYESELEAKDAKEEVSKLLSEIERLRKALKPFADAVYNDNGDVTISYPEIYDYMRARSVLLGKKNTV